jgi:AraC-like DNA-binding protein
MMSTSISGGIIVGEPTISALAFRSVRELLDDDGHDAAALLREVGVDPDRLHADVRVPLHRYHRALREASTTLADPTIGLTLSTRRSTAESFDLLGYLVMHSTTLGDAILRLSRYTGLWAQGIDVVVKEPPAAEVVFEFRVPASTCWPHVQSVLAGSVIVARAITRTNWQPTVVEFALPPPVDTQPFEKLFGGAVRFSAQRNRLSIDDESWRLPVSGADPRLVTHLEHTARALRVRIQPDESVEGRVREHIARHLEAEGVTLARTARALGMSRRTLQRRLAEAGVTFAGLVDEVRRELALHLLEEQRLEVKEAAFRLGFAQPSAFSRAFKRWTGHSPVAHLRA